jgi:beta-1,4-mannosyl-glycoprotein beta-1,4-N-acetylglucosaminyltransferase
MIYSASMYFNELELLDLKVREEAAFVDKMFVVEAAVTFSGNPKPMNFPKDKYGEKVEHIFLEESYFKDCKNPWEREAAQRNAIQSLVRAEDDDVWIVTDVDEIIRGDKIQYIAEETRKHWFVVLRMQVCYYYINVEYPLMQDYSFAATGWVSRRKKFHGLRRHRAMRPRKALPDCGKHFSYLMGPENISLKLKSFSHTEYGGPEFSNVDVVRDRVESLKDVCRRGKTLKIVELDSSYPKTILDNLPDWEKHIYREAVNA